MEIELADVRERLDLKVRGIVHVGAHLGQEYEEYRRLFPNQEITWIEADPITFKRLSQRMQHYKNVHCINAVVADSRQKVTFNRANNEYSSSFLPLGTHSVVHPEVWYVDSFSAETVTLDDLAQIYGFGQSNFLSMDVQGAEAKVLAGGKRFLRGVDYIYSEVARDELYLGCTQLASFDNVLWKLGFARVELVMHEDLGWGNAFYVRQRRPGHLHTLLDRLTSPFGKSRVRDR